MVRFVGGEAIASRTRLRVNDQIKAREVRLVDEGGNQLGIVPLEKALEVAASRDLDLVEVAPQANPPVCRLMDYGKFRFEEDHRERENKRKQAASSIKEMKFRAKIGPTDFETKARQVIKFLSQGHKVKVTVMFRGREAAHPEIGARVLEKLQELVKEVGRVEVEPRLDGSNMVMLLAPSKRPSSDNAARNGKGQVNAQA